MQLHHARREEDPPVQPTAQHTTTLHAAQLAGRAPQCATQLALGCPVLGVVCEPADAHSRWGRQQGRGSRRGLTTGAHEWAASSIAASVMPCTS